MFNILKYEWFRRWKFFLAGIIVFLAANMNLMISINRQEHPRTLTAILIGLAFAMALALFFDHIGRLYRSLYHEEGFWEFTLPLRGYSFLGGKLLAVILECICLGIFLVVIGYLDLKYLAYAIPGDVINSVNLDIVGDMIQISLLLLAVYIMFLLTIYLSMTLSRTLFASFKHGKLIAFGCFLVITKIVEELTYALKFQASDIQQVAPFMSSTDWLSTAAIIVALFLSTGYLVDRKINL